MKPDSFCMGSSRRYFVLPRRMVLALVVFSLCAVLNASPCCAEESLDQFLARYQKAIEPVRAVYRYCSYEGRRVIHIPGKEADDPTRPKAFRVFAKGNRMRLDLGYPAPKNDAGSATIAYASRVSHPDKSFLVRQNPESDKYFLVDILSDPVGTVSFIRRTEMAVDAPFSVRGYGVEEFLRHPDIKVISIEEEPEDNQVRIEFSRKLEPGQVAARNWLLFDADNHMALVEYCLGNFPNTSRLELEYGDRGGDVPVVTATRQFGHLNRDSATSPLELAITEFVDKFDVDAPPDNVFTLAAFGIHEKTGFQIRWYVWLFVASVVLLAVRGWFWWRRSKEAPSR